MSALGHSRRFDPVPATSGLSRTTDIGRPGRRVREVPGSDIVGLVCMNGAVSTRAPGALYAREYWRHSRHWNEHPRLGSISVDLAANYAATKLGHRGPLGSLRI